MRGDDQPLIVDGQISGGVAQGIGAALYERLVFDDEGQPLAASFMDYLVPTATEVPPIEIAHLETPSMVSATGAKGMGEGGTIGAAAILNAVNDALSPLGIEIDRIPVTPMTSPGPSPPADRSALGSAAPTLLRRRGPLPRGDGQKGAAGPSQWFPPPAVGRIWIGCRPPSRRPVFRLPSLCLDRRQTRRVEHFPEDLAGGEEPVVIEMSRRELHADRESGLQPGGDRQSRQPGEVGEGRVAA